jgi:hypothetical protein
MEEVKKYLAIVWETQVFSITEALSKHKHELFGNSLTR